MMMCRLIILMLAGFPVAAATVDMDGWPWAVPITSPEDTAELLQIDLSEEVLDAASPSLNDLRVIDQDGTLIPHAVRRLRSGPDTETKTVAAELINRSYQPGDYSRVVLGLSGPFVKDRVTVDLSGDNYRRRVLLEGGPDGLTWDRIAETWLVEVHQRGREFTLDTIDFPPNNFPYLRLTVFHAPGDPDRVSIRSARTWLRDAPDRGDLVPVVPVAAFQVVPDPENPSVTPIHLDLGYRNLPVSEIELGVADDYFHRSYQLLGRDSETRIVERKTEIGFDKVQEETPWRSVACGSLYRTTHGVSNTTIRVPALAPRYLQLRIFDGDDAPLTVSELEVWRRPVSLLFQYQPGQDYRMLVGKPKTLAPDYDLEQARPDLWRRDWPQARLGALTAIPTSAEGPPDWINDALLWAALVLAVVVALVFIGRNLKH